MKDESTNTKQEDSKESILKQEIEYEVEEFPLEKVQAEPERHLEDESITEDVESPEPEPPAEVSEASEEESKAEISDFSEAELIAEVEDLSKSEPATEVNEFSVIDSPVEVEDLPEQNSPIIAKIANPPITMDKSAGIMDLNKLLRNKKCMVLLGHGSWTCEKVSTFMDEVYSQHPEVQMIKYLGHDMNKFLLCGSIKEGLHQVQNAQGMYSIPIVCFLEQMNLVKILAGIPMAEIEGALNALSSMPLSVRKFS